MHSVLWDEAQIISGKDPDFHRRDLYESIEGGDFPEWELGLQVVEESQEDSFPFDLLDPTKLIPENIVPVRRIGRLTLNRNPDNFFAETEQVAFHPGHVVPGIDFTNDPLLQGRLFSYTDTQLIRLGGPNFHEIPINRPIAPVHNNQRDGHMRQTINKSRAAYEPNSLGGGCPFQMSVKEGGFASFAEQVGDLKVRARGEKFFDHFSQATLFYNSQTETEKDHIVSALRFELGKVEVVDIRQRMLGILLQIDRGLAQRVAAGLGLPTSVDSSVVLNKSIPADGNPGDFQPRASGAILEPSPELSILRSTRADTIKTRRVAVLAADGFDEDDLNKALEALTSQGAQAKIVAPRLGYIRSRQGNDLKVHFSLLTASSVLFDAVYLPGGEKSISTLTKEPAAIEFIREAYRHCKAIGVSQQAVELLKSANLTNTDGDEGIVIGSPAADGKLFTNFIAAVARHRNWTRELLLRPDLRGKKSE